MQDYRSDFGRALVARGERFDPAAAPTIYEYKPSRGAKEYCETSPLWSAGRPDQPDTVVSRVY